MANIAFGCTATASHTLLGFKPNHVTDGQTAQISRWISGVTSSTPWLTVDLGKINYVNRFVLKSASSTEMDRNYDNVHVTVSVSTDNADWAQVKDLLNQSFPVDFTLTTGVGCRYVKISFPTGMTVNQQCAELVELEVYSAPSAYLTSLTISNGTLMPAFNGTQAFTYNDSVDCSVNSVTLTPVTLSPTAVVTIQGATVASGKASQPITLNYGQNAIAIAVNDSNVHINYSVTVFRDDSTLTGITLYDGKNNICPSDFNGNQSGSYKTYAANLSTAVSVTPAAVDPNAVLTVNGTTAASGSPISVPFTGEILQIAVVSTTPSQTLTFTFDITRSSSPYITGFPPFTIPTFSKTNGGPYNVSYGLSTLKLKCTTEDSALPITVTCNNSHHYTINGNPSTAFNIPLDSGVNTVVISTQSATGSDSMTYTLLVTH